MSRLEAAARRTADLLGRDSWLVRHLRPRYESLLDWTANGKGIPWEINGVTYKIDPRQRHRMGQNYDPPVAAFFRERIRPGSLCFDVGANVGVYVLQFAHWSQPDGEVVAFEPNPNACAILDSHIRMNSLLERVRVVTAAVGAASGEQTFFASDADGMSRLGEPNEGLAGRFSELMVPVITLDQYCASTGLRPDCLLIDIEGFEIAALDGARGLIRELKGKLDIVVEMHPNVWNSANTTRDRAEALLADLSLRAIPLTSQTDPLGDYGIVHLAYY